MSKKNRKSKLSKGAIIGGIVGIGALSVYLAMHNRNKKKPLLNSIGKAISYVGEVFDRYEIKEHSPHQISKKSEKPVGDVIDWVSTGMHLWHKFKK
jgi:hypothetical protein